MSPLFQKLQKGTLKLGDKRPTSKFFLMVSLIGCAVSYKRRKPIVSIDIMTNKSNVVYFVAKSIICGLTSFQMWKQINRARVQCQKHQNTLVVIFDFEWLFHSNGYNWCLIMTTTSMHLIGLSIFSLPVCWIMYRYCGRSYMLITFRI